VSVLARLRERGDEADDATVRARGRSGRWYTITASRSEPDALGDCAAIVLIAPVTRADVAPMLDHAFDKVGVRGRRALLARLFLDGTTV
jgi:hypothetical protein